MGLMENIRNERVRNLPLREALTISPDCSVHDAIERMRERQFGCAIVVDAQNKPLGAFTERTVIDLLLQQPESLDSIVVEGHLDEEWFCVRQDDPLLRVIEAVQEKGARFLCVTDDDGRVVAITGQKGLSEYIAEHFPQQVMVQRVGGKPGLETREGA